MENFKQIAEDCLAGKLSGTFILRNGKVFHSTTHLSTTSLYALPYYIAGWCYSVVGNCYSKSVSIRDNDVIDFIPDNMQEQIKIDIPEGKVPIMEQTENGVVITWKKELEYNDIFNHLWEQNTQIGLFAPLVENENTNKFKEKVNVLCQLINIRNYFGKPDGTKHGYYIYKSTKEKFQVASTGYPCIYSNDVVAFREKEHAEQAIKMLGDELKYLFESW